MISERLATKQDVKALELRLKHDPTGRLGSMMVAALGVFTAFAKLL